MSNLRTILGQFFIHLCDLRLVKCGHAQRHEFKEREKIFNQNQFGDECVENLVH
jgi:hypothetical protein